MPLHAARGGGQARHECEREQRSHVNASNARMQHKHACSLSRPFGIRARRFRSKSRSRLILPQSWIAKTADMEERQEGEEEEEEETEETEEETEE